EYSTQPLYVNLEKITDRLTRTFYNQLIVAGIGDAYDFCVDMTGANNIFYTKLRSLDDRSAARLHKLIGIHHTIVYLRDTQRWDGGNFVRALKTVYNLNPRELREYYRLSGVYRRDPSGFEIGFARRTASTVFKVVAMSPASMALMIYFFINSYQQFKADNPQYFLESEKIAG
ncbi:MAG: hypothetical protein FWF44_08795, partial [Defluviitaleaceae bacterium]|nr:hypothetical protein [Defluviitaleaceae bacterium]